MDADEGGEKQTLTIKDDKNFLAFFKSLPPKTSNLIRFFDRKEFYTAHGEDASHIALNINGSSRELKYWSSDASKTPYVTVRNGIEFEDLVNKLLRLHQFTIEVYATSEKKRGQWECIKRGSPGNLQEFEDVLFVNNELKDSTIIMAARFGAEGGNKMVGVAFADATLRHLGVSQFQDTDTFVNFESFLMQKGAKECILIDDKSYDFKKIATMLESVGIPLITRPKGEFSDKNVVQDLDRLLGSVQNILPELDKSLAMQATGCLITYLDLLANESNFGHYKMGSFSLSDYMRLDAAAFRALNIVKSNGDAVGGTTLFGFLDECNTPMGSRKLMQYIKQPIIDLDTIKQRQDFVEAFVEDSTLREQLRSNYLKKIPDCDRLVKSLTSKRAKLEHCVQAYGCISKMPGLKNVLDSYSGQHAELVSQAFSVPLQGLIEEFDKFVTLIENTIDLEHADEHHEFTIKNSFSPSLTKIYEEKKETLDSMEKEKKKVARDLGMDDAKVKFDNNSQFGHFFRVPRKDDNKISGKPGTYSVLDTRKDGVKFRTSHMTKLNDIYKKSAEEYEVKQKELATKVLDISLSYMPSLERLSELLSTLDVYVNLAYVASRSSSSYVKPEMLPMGSGILELKASRHPCVEAQDDVNFIANDVYLERESSRFHIITGPNMGGKSTYIRQVGVIVLMAQMGSYVPCEYAKISIQDCILARVGAGDSQLRGVSTFMAEMLETAAILKSATENSLVIVDELGRGTSTYDGFGLAWAISKYICTKIRSFCLFATHFHELTVLEEKIEGVKNLHVTAKTTEDNLSLLYKVEKGPCDQSFGIHVARLAHFPETVIEAAKKKARELENFDNSMSDVADSSNPEEEQKISSFLKQFVQLPLDTLGAAEGLDAVKKLTNQFAFKPSILGKRAHNET